MYILGLCTLAAVLTCALDLVLAGLSFKRGGRLGKPFGNVCLMSALVVVSYYFSIIYKDYFAASLASSVYFIGIDLVLNFMLIFTMLFTGYENSAAARAAHKCSRVCFLVDAVTLAVNPFREIAISYVLRDTIVAHYSYKMYFMYGSHLIYCYALVVVIAVLLVVKAFTVPIEYGSQYLLTTLSLSAIVWINILFLFVPNTSVWNLIDMSIIGYSIAAMFIYWCCFIYPTSGMLNSLRNGIFESVDQGIILFDLEDRLILHNSSAERLLPGEALSTDVAIDRFAHLCGIPLEDCRPVKHYSAQCYAERNDEKTPLRVDYRKMLNKRGLMLGQLFVISDASQEMDHLTGFMNWDAFCKLERKKTERHNYPITVTVFDINGLSVINRTKGMDAGDRHILELAELIRSAYNQGAYFIRGRDSALIMLSSRINETASHKLAEQIRKDFSFSVQFALSTAERAGTLLDAIERAEATLHIKKLIDPDSAHAALVSSLIRTMEEWDPATRQHMERTQQMCLALGREMALCDDDMSTLALFSLLHDIGKVGMPLEILHKPGWMTEEEMSILRSHVVKGDQIARSTPELEGIAALIRSHHERWDGAGYPDGLRGEQIPRLARILTVVDSYDAMTHNRTYRKSLAPEAAQQELRSCAGSQFDPTIVQSFLKVLSTEHFQTDYDSEAPADTEPAQETAQAPLSDAVQFYPLNYARYLLDENMVIIAADAQFEKLTGYTRADVEQRRVSQGDLILPEERTRYFEMVTEQLQERPVGFIEHTLVCKDGKTRYVLCMGRLFFDAVAMAQRAEIYITDYQDTFAAKKMQEDARDAAEKWMKHWEDTLRRDPLTGLLNHSAFINAAMQTALNPETRALLMIMDIDSFKQLNDSFGHPAGDEQLLFTAQVLQETVGTNGLVGRLGGDEFAAMLTFPADTTEEAMHDEGRGVFERLNEALRTAKYPSTISVGADLVRPGVGFNTLYEQADRALYLSKKNGRSRYSAAPGSVR